MFVKVIRDGTSALYECDQVRMRPGDDPDTVFVMMEGMLSRDHMTLEIDKNTTEVYYMNHDGKTIDTYRWLSSKTPPGPDNPEDDMRSFLREVGPCV